MDCTQIRAIRFKRQFRPNSRLRQIDFGHGAFKAHLPTLRVAYKAAFGT